MALGITLQMQTQVSQLYVALFGRAPASAGLGYWAQELVVGTSLTTVANQMFATEPARAYYPASFTNAQIVTSFFTNVLGRPPATGGLNYWVGELNMPTASVGSVINSMIASCVSYVAGSNPDPATDALGVTSAALFANKTEVALYFALGTGSATLAETALVGVTADRASIAIVEARNDAAIAAISGVTFTLTTGVDTTLIGGSGDDTFNGTNTSLSAGDSLAGGLGADTLAVTSILGGTYGTGVTTSSIEALRVTATIGTATVDATSMSGVTSVTNYGSTADVVVSGLTAIPVVNITATSNNTTVSEKAAAVAGLTDAMTINLNAVGTAAGATTITVDGIEILNVATTGSASGSASNTVTLVDSAAVTTLNVTGTAGAKLAVNLSGATATVTGTVTSADGADDIAITADATDKLSISMGAGNDTVRIANIAATHTIAGGDGTDTLVTTAAITTTTGANISGFEAVSVGALSVALPTATNPVAAVTFTGTGGSVTGLLTGGTITQAAAGTNAVVNTGWTGTADALTVNFGTATSTTLAAQSLTALLALEAVTINNLQLSTDVSARSVGATGAAIQTITVNSAGAAPITITGGGAALTAVNASGVSGAVTFGLTTLATAGAALTGGGGNDVITGAAGNDTIVGGAGTDTITGGLGADALTGGDGADTFVIGANTATLSYSTATASDVIADFVSGTDKIQTGQAVTSFLGNFANIQGALAAQNTYATAGGAAFVTGENNLYVFTNTGGTLNTLDTIVKLTGVTALATNGSDLLLGSQGATGGANITLSAAAATVSTSGALVNAAVTTVGDTVVNTTAFDDTVNATAAIMAGTASALDGGAGRDTLSVTGTAGGALVITGVTNFEVINLANAVAAYTVTATNTNINTGGSLAINAGSTTGLTALGAAFSPSTTISGIGVTGVRTLSITGGSGNDVLTGGAGNDTIIGGAGNDTIGGTSGVDSLSGGDGDDQITVGGAGSVIDGGAGNDTVITSVASLLGSTLGGGAGTADALNITYSVTASEGVTLAATAVVSGAAAFTGFETVNATLGGATQTLAVTPDASTLIVNFAGAFAESLTGTGGTITVGQVAGQTLALAGTSSFSVAGGTTGAITSTATAGTLTVTGIAAQTITSAMPVTLAAAALGAVDSLNGNGAYTVTGLGTVASSGITEGTSHTTANLTVGVAGTFANTITLNAAGTGTVAITDAQTTAVTTTLVTSSTTHTVTVSMTGALGNFTETGSQPVSVTATTGAHAIVTGSGADTIVSSSGNDTITGGVGADKITLGGGVDVVNVTATTDTGIASGFVDTQTVQAANGYSIGTAALDIITGFIAGDQLNVGLGFTGITRNNEALAFAKEAMLMGTYSPSANTFTVGSSGLDTLVAYDGDGVAGGNWYGVVLVGYVDATGNDTATTGLLGVA